jgi:homogentisate 1,2-dioxygenase
MNEYMGLISGAYDAKAEGFAPGGGSLHPRMSAHGPDAEVTRAAMDAKLAPHKIDNGVAFMFETAALMRLTRFAAEAQERQRDYDSCWASLDRFYRGEGR